MEANLLNPKQAAAALNMSHSWLALARSRGEGPDFIRVGNGRGRVRYTREQLDAYVADLAKQKRG